MRIGRILYPVHELGPGNRIAIWVQGCHRRCEDCANPELWDSDDKKELNIDILSSIVCAAITSEKLDGITITGGEPMEQTKELSILLSRIKHLCNDILVFTGYSYAELSNSKNADTQKCLSLISVLVDGQYIPELNSGERLRGSTNQKIVIQDTTKKELYYSYIHEGERCIDNFIAKDGIVSVGIHPKDFEVLTGKSRIGYQKGWGSV